jgi:hypothetical protein
MTFAVLARRLLLLVCLSACAETAEPERVRDVRPLGTLPASAAALARFVRRAELDLRGQAPSDAAVEEVVGRLQKANDLAGERQLFVAELLDGEAHAQRSVAELEARVFAGQGRAQRFSLSCTEAIVGNPVCEGCLGADPCACACAPVTSTVAANQTLDAAAAQLRAGAATSAIERLYAESPAFYAGSFADPNQRARRLFEVFLQRAPGVEELENAAAMMLGPLVDDPATIVQRASGVLFGREGKRQADLLDIVFGSEVYRESLVRGVFARYLGREPSARELMYFTRVLDPDAPDTRSVVEAVVASKEYFAQ